MSKGKTETIRDIYNILDANRRAPKEPVPQRPRTRRECVNGPRPCPWVGCKHNLLLDVLPTGAITYPHGEVDEAMDTVSETCTLDIVDKLEDSPKNGEIITLEKVGEYLGGLTRERVRQIEKKSLSALVIKARNSPTLREYEPVELDTQPDFD